MRMIDPVPTFSYLTEQLRDNFPDLAYLHFTEPVLESIKHPETGSNDPFRQIWAPRLFLSAIHTLESALKAAEEKGDIVVFGRYYIANVRFHLLSF